MVKLPENLSSTTQLKSKTDFAESNTKKVQHEFNAAPFFCRHTQWIIAGIM